LPTFHQAEGFGGSGHVVRLLQGGRLRDLLAGFAFGLGLDRMAMVKFDIPNIRTLFENDLRVLQQF
jgi:phenylalanyl-tRNA synthetase alpha chain